MSVFIEADEGDGEEEEDEESGSELGPYYNSTYRTIYVEGGKIEPLLNTVFKSKKWIILRKDQINERGIHFKWISNSIQSLTNFNSRCQIVNSFLI